MKVEIYLTPQEFTEERLKDQIAVVVDVLRSCTTICAALAAGAKEIIPAESVSSAIELASNLSKDTILLCGERLHIGPDGRPGGRAGLGDERSDAAGGCSRR